jgi:CheY-like chemotaxis protein
MSRIKILVVDDSRDFRESATALLSRHPHLEVVGVAACGAEALPLVARLSPQLVLVGVFMRGMDGFEVTSHLNALPRRPRVILVSGSDTEELRLIARALEADDFIPQADFAAQILPALRRLFPPGNRLNQETGASRRVSL